MGGGGEGGARGIDEGRSEGHVGKSEDVWGKRGGWEGWRCVGERGREIRGVDEGMMKDGLTVRGK